jgi:hypothetical protein
MAACGKGIVNICDSSVIDTLKNNLPKGW